MNFPLDHLFSGRYKIDHVKLTMHLPKENINIYFIDIPHSFKMLDMCVMEENKVKKYIKNNNVENTRNV